MNFFRPTGNLDVARARIEPSKVEVTETKSIHSSEDELDRREAVAERLPSPPRRQKLKGANRKQNKDFRSVWYDEEVEHVTPSKMGGLKKATSVDNLLEVGIGRLKPRPVLSKKMISSPCDPRKIVGEWSRVPEVENDLFDIGSLKRKLSGPVEYATAAVEYFSKKITERTGSSGSVGKSESRRSSRSTNTNDRKSQESKKEEHCTASSSSIECVKTEEKAGPEPSDCPLEEKCSSLPPEMNEKKEEEIDAQGVVEPKVLAVESEENSKIQPEIEVVAFSSPVTLDSTEEEAKQTQANLETTINPVEEGIKEEKTEEPPKQVATKTEDVEKEEKLIETKTEPQPVIELDNKTAPEDHVNKEEKVIVEIQSEPQPVAQFNITITPENDADKEEKPVEVQPEDQLSIGSTTTGNTEHLCDAKNTVYGPETIVLPETSTPSASNIPEPRTFTKTPSTATSETMVAEPAPLTGKETHFKRHPGVDSRGKFRRVGKADISAPILPKMMLGDGNAMYLDNLNSEEVTSLLKQTSNSTSASFVCILSLFF